jgi:voltage-gated potassium channel
MKSVRFNAFLQANLGIIIPVILTALVIILGGIAVYLAEHEHPGANITTLGDALWWSVITITTVGYGDYTPITVLGRIIGTVVMFSGIGIAVTLVTIISQNRVQCMQERLKSKAEGKGKGRAMILANETKETINQKIEGIEKLTEEDFDSLVTMMRSLRLTLLGQSNDAYKCPRCGIGYRSKPKFCGNCGHAFT